MSVPYDPENRFLRCAYEHKYGNRGVNPPPVDDRFRRFVEEERTPRKQSADDWFQERKSQTSSLPSTPVTYISKRPSTPQSSPSSDIYLSKPSTPLSPILLRMTKTKRGLSLEDDFPLLNGQKPTIPKKIPQLPNTEDRIICKELPLPEPKFAACSTKGTIRMVYDIDNPDYVPEKTYQTIIEKAKSGSWSQRLKDSLTGD